MHGRRCPECNGEGRTRGNCRCETCDGTGWIGPEITAGDTSLTVKQFTDQPSHRAMKAATTIHQIWREWKAIGNPHHDGFDKLGCAAIIDQEFPAYLEIREALERVANTPHQSRTINHHAEHCPKCIAEAALAKARKET